MKYRYADHIEIPVPDLEKAKQFYGKVFGWEGKMQDWSESYILVFNSENTLSPTFGLVLHEEIPENKVVVTMGVDDIGKALKEIKSAGGKVTQEKYEISPEIGHGANFTDPFGNKWGLHSPPAQEE